MNQPTKLEYTRNRPKLGNSRFAVASVSIVAINYPFIIAAGFFGVTPFNSMGNGKETLVAIVAAILGILLAIRAIQDPKRKQNLAVLGVVLNACAIPCALVFLPYI